MTRREATRMGAQYGRFWVVAGLVCAFACGGKADNGSGEGEPSNADAGASSDPSTKGPSTPGQTPGTAGKTELGACKLGFLLEDEPTRDCAWLARDRCYDTKLAACACICPANRQDSICSSGFDDGPNGKTEVKCY